MKMGSSSGMRYSRGKVTTMTRSLSTFAAPGHVPTPLAEIKFSEPLHVLAFDQSLAHTGVVEVKFPGKEYATAIESGNCLPFKIVSTWQYNAANDLKGTKAELAGTIAWYHDLFDYLYGGLLRCGISRFWRFNARLFSTKSHLLPTGISGVKAHCSLQP